MNRKLLSVAASGIIALAMSCNDAIDDQATTVVDTPQFADGKADIYGADSRRELYDPAVFSAHEQAAEATAVVVGGGGFFDLTSTRAVLNARTLAVKMEGELGGPLCSTERFLEQPAPGFCSAFLIAPDLVATAGHCVNINTAVHQASYVFGFGYDSANDPDVRDIPVGDVYRANTVVGHLYDKGEGGLLTYANGELWSDWAVVQLDRPVTNRQPVTLRTSPLGDGDVVTAIGHPSGLPTKLTRGRVVDASKVHFVNTDLDIYQGNSGSLVADEDGNAAGIVIRGTGGNSFRQTASGCYASNQCSAFDATAGSGCTGNHVMRSDALRAFVDPGVQRIVQNQLPPTTAEIPDGSTSGVSLSQHVSTSDKIAFVTVNANLWHIAPRQLEFYLEHDGHSVLLARHPTVWSGGDVRFSRTTHELDGLDAGGDWTLRVVDKTADGAQSQQVQWWQIVLGTTSATPQPPVTTTPTPFVGTTCETDGDCDFDSSGTPGFCYDFDTAQGARGFCTVPCEGYCPDRTGFATTFCIASDAPDVGICAARPDALNGFCADIEGTRISDETRFVGSSSAPSASRPVCAPE